MSTSSGGGVAEPSRPPNFKAFGVDRKCYGCGRKLTATEPGGRWFTSIPHRAVFGACCFQLVTAYQPLEEAA